MRLEKTIVVRENDKDLTFVVKQMPATKGFRFGLKCGKLLARCQSDALEGKTVLDVLLNAFAVLDLDAVDSIMEEALSCVTYTSPVGVQVCTPDTLDTIIDDPTHVFELLQASLQVNLVFLTRHLPEDFQKKLRGAIEQAGQTLQTSAKVEK